MKSWNLAFLFLLASVPALADPADWSYRAPILPVEPLADRLVEFPLTPEVFDAAQPDLSDLRVMSDSGLEAGHVIRVLEGSYRELQLEGRLFDRTFVPGSRASAILDFGSRILKNRIRVDTTGTEFRRTVRVEGSQDATTWERLREGAVLYRLPASEDARRVDLGLVSLPQNDFRYLRVSVFPGRDDAGEFGIVDIRSSREESVPPGLVEVPARSFEVVPDRGASDLHVDLGFRNLPLYELTLRVRDRQFYRNVTLFGRNAAERTVPTRNEDGRETTRVEAEPWHRMTSGVVHRFTADDENDESLVLSLSGHGYRHLLVRIENGNDPPLAVDGVVVRRLDTRLGYLPRTAEGHSLVFGNPRASKPVYDLPRFADRIRADGVVKATLGLSSVQTAPSPPEPPWLDRNPWVLWVALLAGFLVICLLIARQVREARDRP